MLTWSLMMTLYPVRRSLSLTQDMADRLALLVSQQNRDVTEADLIRDAIRRYLDEQADLMGSRKHFQRSFERRLDALEAALSFHLDVLLFLILGGQVDNAALNAAVDAARKHHAALSKHLASVRHE